jgi:hypothetical protein
MTFLDAPYGAQYKFNISFFQIPTLWGIARHFFAVILHLYFKYIIINVNIKRMKTFRFNFLTFAAVIIGALFFITCCGDEDEKPDSLSVSQKEFIFEADDTGNQSAEITTSAENWQAESSYSWLSLSPSGNKLSISVEKYTNTEGPRTGAIIIQAGTAEPVSISVTQKAQHSLSISPESLAFEPDGSAQEVTITTTAPSWEATKTSDGNWFSFSKQEGTKLIVTVDKNINTEGREATIKITAGNATEKTLTVTQGKSHTLDISPASLTFAPSETAAQTVTITTTAPSWVATPSDEWVTLTPQDDELRVSVSENSSTESRSATITITAGMAPERTITVTQNPHTLSVSLSSLSFGASETAAQSVTVTTTVSSWNMTTNDSWIQLTKQGDDIRVTVSSNSSTSLRSGTVSVTAGTLERTVTVTQEGVSPALSVSPTSISFTASETAEKTVTVTTTASSWNATKTDDWIKLTNQGNTIRVTVLSNSSTSPRSGTIKVTAASLERTVSVTQEGAVSEDYISVSPQSFSFEAVASNETVTVTANVSSWNATTTASWLTLTKQNSTTLSVSATANTTSSTRSATIGFTAGTASVTVSVSQKPSGHSYLIVRELKTWSAAFADAKARGGYLVEINSQEEQDAVYAAIQSSGISTTYTAVTDGGGAAYIWIGASDKATEGKWVWAESNTEFWNSGPVGNRYHNWGGKQSGTVHEPDDHGGQQDAAAIGLAKWPTGPGVGLGVAGEWNDIDETNTLYYIVEFDE